MSQTTSFSPKSQRRRVVITGIGAISPAGNTLEETWKTVLEGKSNGGVISLFDASRMPCKVSYEIKNFDEVPKFLEENDVQFGVRSTTLALSAVNDALVSSGLKNPDETLSERMGVCLGVGVSSPDFKWFSEIFCEEKYTDASLRYQSRHFPFTLSSHVAKFAKTKGGNFTIHTACASSGQAMGEAFDLVARGHLDIALTGGVDSMINPLHMAGFNLLGALATECTDPQTASRPFDTKRSGFVMGEGACMLIFEDLEHALKRNAKIYAEVLGYGVTESAYRITDLHPEGEGPIEAMQMALEEAGLNPQDIQYINAHGTSTRLNDMIESLSISKVFPKPNCNVKVSSTKSVTGHLISGAGALELAICVKALQDQVYPPTTNLQVKDPDCTVDLTDFTPQKGTLNYALSNSIGFGGSNTALIVGRWNHD